MAEELPDRNERMISQFNDAVAQQMRLDRSWQNCAIFLKSGRLSDYKWELYVAEIELAYDAERFKLDKKIADVNTKIAKCKNSRGMFFLLMEKEKILRFVQNKVGKGGKYAPDDEDGM